MTTAIKKKTGSTSKKNQSKNSAKKATSRKSGWMNTVVNICIVAAIGALVTVGVKYYKAGYEAERDLSVVGNGMPTIVQIHDSGCRLCKSLKSNTESALGSLKDDAVQYRVADINTPKGKKFQNKYDVPHVTLLLFDKNGELKRTLTGVRETDELLSIFKIFVG